MFIQKYALWAGITILGVGLSLMHWSHAFDVGVLKMTLEGVGKILETCGAAVIVFKLFSLTIETVEWKDYFSKSLIDIVVKDNYIKSLEEKKIRQMRKSLYRSLYNNESIDAPDSFFSYFDRKMSKYLGMPFRDNVNVLLIVSDIENGCARIKDSISYDCRAIGGKIQEKVAWRSDPGEFDKVESVKVVVKYPDTHKQAGEKEEFDAQVKNESESWVIDPVSLEKYQGIDGLNVSITSVYLSRIDSLYAWEMAYPTKGFHFTFKCPEEYEIVCKALTIAPELCSIRTESQVLAVACSSWVLPHNGIVWMLRKIQDSCVISGDAGGLSCSTASAAGSDSI